MKSLLYRFARTIFILLALSPVNCFSKYITAEQIGSYEYGGFNLQYGELSKKDVDLLISTNAKACRVHLQLKYNSKSNTFYYDVSDYYRVVRLLSKLKDSTVGLIIVLEIPPNDVQPYLWTEKSARNSFVSLWGKLAKTFVNTETIIGYDILNEPMPPDADNISNSGQLWWSLARDVVEKIRSVDKNHAIILESSPSALPGTFSSMTPIEDNNIVYSFHFYEPHQLTHQGLMGFEKNRPYPGFVSGRGYWDRDRLMSYFSTVIEFRDKYSVPIQMGEFSFIRYSPQGSRLRYMSDVLSIVKEYNIGWLYHSFREWDGWDAEKPSSPSASFSDARSNTATEYMLIINALK